MDKKVAVIEISSKQIKIVVGFEKDGQVYVIYTLSKNISGYIENGHVVDPNGLAQEIIKVSDIYDGSAKLEIKISKYILILPPCGLKVREDEKTSSVVSDELKISEIDIKNVFAIIKNSVPPDEGTIIDIVPRYYIANKDEKSNNPPYGTVSRIVTANANIHILPSDLAHGYSETAKAAKITIERTVVAPFAASELINTYLENTPNYFIVDIGSNMTSVSLIGRGKVYRGMTFNLGGENITRRISDDFNISMQEAENLKILYGIDNRVMHFKAPVCTVDDGTGKMIKHYVDELNNAIKDELNNFLKSLRASIDELTNDIDSSNKKLPLIFIGGGSLLNGLVKYAEPKIDNEKVICMLPKVLGARDPAYFNCLGAILVQAKYPTTINDNQSKVVSVTREK